MVKNTVLFVDDELNILASIRRATEDEDFIAVFASSGGEALEIFEKRHISVIVTDMRMPEMNGLTLLKTIREKYPNTVRIVLSGYTQLSQVLATVNQGDIFQFIPKPWNMEEELLVTVRRGIEHYNLAAERDRLQAGLAQKNQAYQSIFRAMEQKMANEKKDLASLRRINHWTCTFWKKHLEIREGHSNETNVILKGYCEFIEELQRLYLDILPTVVENKSIESMVGDVTKACAGRMLIQNTDNPENTDMVFSGCHRFIVMVCRAVVYLVKDNSKESMHCIIKVTEDMGVAALIDLTIGLQLIKPTADEQTSIKIGCSLLNAMGESYDIKVLPEVINGEIRAVKVLWKTLRVMNGIGGNAMI